MKYRDFEEFIASLNASGARYLVVGAHAVAHHARPRATKDLDLFVGGDADNARRVLAAVTSFFGTDVGYTPADLADPDVALQMGVAPVRIDVMTALSGVASFEVAWGARIDARFGDQPAHYISLPHLIATKEATGRKQDLADLIPLRRALAAARTTVRRRRPSAGKA